jgi:hypothetical protein
MRRFFPGVGRARILAVCAALLFTCASPNPASAYPLLFSFTGGINGTFQIDSNPTPTALYVSAFDARFITGSAAGDFAGAGGGEFYLPSGGGGLATYAGPSNNTFIGLDGPQLFAGALTAPVFAPGTFVLHDSGGVTPTRLTITGPGAPAPELGAGFLEGALALLVLAITRRSGRTAAI